MTPTCKSDIVLVLITQGHPSHSLLSVFAPQPVRQPAGDVPELLSIGELDVVILLLPQGHQVHIVLSVLQNVLQLPRQTSPAPLAIRKLNEEDRMKILCNILALDSLELNGRTNERTN